MRIARTLHIVGYLLLLGMAVPTLVDRHTAWNGRLFEWLAAYGLFAAAHHIGASAPEGARRLRMGALAFMVPTMLVLGGLEVCHFASLSLLIVASQAALLLSPRATAALIVGQSTALGAVIVYSYPHCDPRERAATMTAYIAGEIFAAVAVHAARREAEARNALERTNAELRATRSLLEETSRVNERTRIARELHDVLGHDLTALGLQLEVATHVPPERAGEHVAKAKDVSARLLCNVRDVVSTMRASCGGPDLGSALRELVENVPGLRVHLTVPESFCVDDGAKGHCILRCVQEIVTNTLRHAGAQNLWITIAQSADAITVDARDDGCCAGALRAGHGLTGMRARIEELGGWLQLAAGASRELVVSAKLPLKVDVS